MTLDSASSKGISLAAGAVNIVNLAIGFGALALPLAFLEAGLLLGIVVLVR